MIKKLQILLAYLGLILILGHGMVPHHHHEAFFEEECNGIAHAAEHHHCDFSKTEHGTEKEIVCHFQILSNKLSFDKYFVTGSTVDSDSSYLHKGVHYIIYQSPVLSHNYQKFPSFRAPPALA